MHPDDEFYVPFMERLTPAQLKLFRKRRDKLKREWARRHARKAERGPDVTDAQIMRRDRIEIRIVAGLAALALAALVCALATGCSTSRASSGGWTGPEPITSDMRQQCLDIWAAEIERRSPDGPAPRPLREFERLRVRVSVGVPRLSSAEHVAEAVRQPCGGYDIMFRAAAPSRDLWRHEAAHPYLIAHGMGASHPKEFGKRHGLWNWRD